MEYKLVLFFFLVFIPLIFLFSIYISEIKPKEILICILISILSFLFLYYERKIGLKNLILTTFFITMSFNIELSIYDKPTIAHTGGLPSNISVTHVYLITLVWFFITLIDNKDKNLTRTKPEYKVELILFVLLLGTGGLSLFFASNKIAALYMLIRYVVTIFLLILINKYPLVKIWKYFIGGIVFTVLFQFAVGVGEILTNGSVGLTILGENPNPFRAGGVDGTEKGMGGTLGHPGSLALFLIIVLPFILTNLISPQVKGFKKFGYIITLLLGYLSILLSNARTSIVLMIIGILLIFFGNLWINNRRKKSSSRIIGYGAVLVFITIFVIGLTFDNLKERFFHSDFIFQIGGRTNISSIGLDVIFENVRNFLLGVGLNNYTDTISKFGSDFSHTHPVHNIYLLLWAEGGIFHMLVYIVILVTILFKMLKVMYYGSVELATKALAVFVSIITIAVYNFTGWSPIHNQPFMLFVILIAISISITTEYKKSTNSD
ncbi:O-antigen ligase family protein [Paenibacillus alvei]